jgi:hypothetical protein
MIRQENARVGMWCGLVCRAKKNCMSKLPASWLSYRYVLYDAGREFAEHA